MNTLNFKDRVRKFEDILTETEEQIAAYIATHAEQIPSMSIKNLADVVYSVPNTIVRLCKKLEYDGFSHLKLSLKEEATEANKIIKNQVFHNIQKTNELIDENKFDKIARRLVKSKKVAFYGLGDSNLICEIAARKFKKMGIACSFFKHRDDLIDELFIFKTIDTLFFVSMSGETTSVLELAEVAKERNLTTISITGFSENTLSSHCNINLFCYGHKELYGRIDMTDTSLPLFLIDSLSMYLKNYHLYTKKLKI